MKLSVRIAFAFIVLSFADTVSAKDYVIDSPCGNISITVHVGDELEWSVRYIDETILEPSPISLSVKGQKSTFGESPVVRKTEREFVDRLLEAVVPIKFRTVRDRFNGLKLFFRDDWAVSFRAYDNGVAYRFETFLNGTVQVEDESAEWRFADDCVAYWPEENNPDFISHCEAYFKPIELSSIRKEEYAYLPVSMQTSMGTRIVITETDLYDYPNLFLFGGNGRNLSSVFPQVITETRMRTDRDVDVIEKADYIAETSGSRTFPWRIMTIGDDRSLLENTLPWQLASPEIEGDMSWIRPGHISWEWWCMLNVYGVDFVAGVNTETYKYYIDFAAKYGLEYILMDEGWSASTLDIVHCKPGLDVKELVDYGHEKGVGVVLWTLWTPMMEDMEKILDTYRDWGVKGIKLDFMQRTDQPMVNFYEDVAKACFKRHMIVDFHGSFKPAGLHRKYPNVMSFEGVYGMEHDKCSSDISPEHDLVLPFTRMVAGPMDYTPGATINATKDDFSIRWNHPMSQGTRAHQAAIFIAFDSPVQMLCDSPSNYYGEPEFTEFISSLPTVWDETKAITAKAGDYLLVARRSGKDWYVAGLNDWTGRELSCSLDFLGEGDYVARIFKDGTNADFWAEDFKCESIVVRASETLAVKMANGGGWAAIITPIEK